MSRFLNRVVTFSLVSCLIIDPFTANLSAASFTNLNPSSVIFQSIEKSSTFGRQAVVESLGFFRRSFSLKPLQRLVLGIPRPRVIQIERADTAGGRILRNGVKIISLWLHNVTWVAVLFGTIGLVAGPSLSQTKLHAPAQKGPHTSSATHSTEAADRSVKAAFQRVENTYPVQFDFNFLHLKSRQLQNTFEKKMAAQVQEGLDQISLISPDLAQRSIYNTNSPRRFIAAFPGQFEPTMIEVMTPLSTSEERIIDVSPNNVDGDTPKIKQFIIKTGLGYHYSELPINVQEGWESGFRNYQKKRSQQMRGADIVSQAKGFFRDLTETKKSSDVKSEAEAFFREQLNFYFTNPTQGDPDAHRLIDELLGTGRLSVEKGASIRSAWQAFAPYAVAIAVAIISFFSIKFIHRKIAFKKTSA